MAQKLPLIFVNLGIVAVLSSCSLFPFLNIGNSPNVGDLPSTHELPTVAERLAASARYILNGEVRWPQGREVLAAPGAVINQATISLIDYSSGATVATSLTDGLGAFTIVTGTYVPPVGNYYLIEASKGLGGQLPGNYGVRMRSIVQWNGSGWISITNAAPGGSIRIHQLTTSIALHVGLGSFVPSLTIDTVDLAVPPSLKVGSIGGVTGVDLINLATDVKNFVVADRDPVAETSAIVPVIGAVIPSTGGPSTLVQVTGSGFSSLIGATTVKFGALAGTTLMVGPHDVYAQVPPGAPGGATTVTVQTPRGTSNGLAFTVPTVAAAAGLRISAVQPNPVNRGSMTATFYGTGFVSPTTANTFVFAKKGGGTTSPVAGDYLAGDATSLTVRLPADAESGLAYFSNASGTATSVFVDITAYGDNPVINSTFPNAAASWTDMYVKGTNFGVTPGTVKVGTVAATVTSWSDTKIRLKVPAGLAAGASTVTVTNSSGGTGATGLTLLGGTIRAASWVSTAYTAANMGYTPPTLAFSGDKIYVFGGNANGTVSSITLNADGSPASFQASIGLLPYGINSADMQGDLITWIGERAYAFDGDATTNAGYVKFDVNDNWDGSFTADNLPTTTNEPGLAAGSRGIYYGGGYTATHCYYKTYNLSSKTFSAWTGPVTMIYNTSMDGAFIVLNDRLWEINVGGATYANLNADGSISGVFNPYGSGVVTGWDGNVPNIIAIGSYLYTINGWGQLGNSQIRQTTIIGANSPGTTTTWPVWATANISVGSSGGLIAVGRYLYKVAGGNPTVTNVFYTQID